MSEITDNYVNLTGEEINLVNAQTGEVMHTFKSEGKALVSNPICKTHDMDGIPYGNLMFNRLEELTLGNDKMYILPFKAFKAAKEMGFVNVCYPAGHKVQDNQFKEYTFLCINE